MVLELPWAQKRIFWAFEKIIFQFFVNFRVKKLKPLSREMRQSVQNYLNQNLVIGSFLENGFEATLGSKTNMSWAFERNIFQFFGNFWVKKLKPLSREMRHSVQNYLNQTLITGNFLENRFEATLSSKTNALSVWKKHFSVFESRNWNYFLIFWVQEPS